MENTNKNNTTAPFEIGDIICGIHNNRCAITNERMKKAEVIKLYYDSLGVSMKIKILEHENDIEIGKEYVVKNDNNMFRLVKLNIDKSIHITTDGVTTTAVFKDGNKVIEQSSTKCNPLDEFDFNIGSRIAFDRLMDKVTPLKLMHEDEVLGVIGEPIDETDSFGNKLHVGDIVTNVILRDGNRPMRNFAKAICINKEQLGIISKSLRDGKFDADGIIVLLKPYTSLLEKGRGYKIMEGLEVK